MQENQPFLKLSKTSSSYYGYTRTSQSVDDKQKQTRISFRAFYQSITRWSYTMETATMFSRIQEHIKVQQNPIPLK